MTDSQDQIWAARLTAAGFRESGFREGLGLAIDALRQHAVSLKAASKSSDTEYQAHVLKEAAAAVSQIASALRKLKPSRPAGA